MRIRKFMKGQQLEGVVIRFADDIRDAGKKVGIKYDGEWLRKVKPENADGEWLIGVYDPNASSFDFERMVGDIMESLGEMGVCVES